jgi:O-antigen/teichoic acid export membrane protein
LVLARLIAAFMTVFIPLVLARVMTLESYGTYKQVILIATTLYMVLPFGVAQALYYFVPRARESRPYSMNALLFVLAAGLLAVAGLVGFAGPLARMLSNPDLVNYRWPMALYTLGLVAAYPLEIGLTSQGNTRAAALCYLFTDMVRSLLMVVPVLMGHGLMAVMNGLALFGLLRLVATWGVLLATTKGPFWRKSTFIEQIKYAAPFGAAMVVGRPSQYAHQYAVSAVVSPTEFAVYSVGCFQVPLVDLLYTPTSEVLMVELGEMEASGRLAQAVLAFKEATAKLALFFFPLSGLLTAAAPEFIGAAFGTRFLGATPVFRVSVLGIVFSVLPLDGLLRARGKTREIFWAYGVKAAAAIPLVALGVHFLGMVGGILSYAAGELVGKAMLMKHMPASLSSPERQVRFWECLPWATLGRTGLATVVAAATVPFVRHVLAGRWVGMGELVARGLPLAACGAVFLVAYVAGLWLLGVRPQALVGALKRPDAPRPASA